jgi:hypothetical protein
MDEHPWPQTGAKLFIEGGNYHEFSHFGWGNTPQEFAGYIYGYKEAADTLISQAISSKDISKLDTWVFPVLFLYRQYVELQMKDLVLNYGNMDLEEKKNFLKKAGHDLMKIWNKLKPTLENIASDNKEKNDVEIAESYVKQLHDRDPNSVVFRYPIGMDLQKALDKEYKINLKNLSLRMQELENFFNGVDGALSERKGNESYF